MGVYIRGMEMPMSCAECPVNMNICKRGYKFLLKHMELYDQRANDCPISSVPPHGRLIDADMLIKFVEDRYEITWESDCYEGGIKDACSDILEKIDTMPTVIEAEDGE
jgi:hypothetical protein